MNLTTKDLFELAGIHWDASNKHHDPESFDTGPWDGLTPLEQAAEAEGIRAVVEELDRRRTLRIQTDQSQGVIRVHTPETGWREIGVAAEPPVFRPIDTDPFLISAPETRSPRRWDRIEDVPTDVAVTDCDRDRWEFRNGAWGIAHVDGFFDDSWHSRNTFAPFTEIIEDKPNTEGPWDRWNDVPDGVKYRPLNAPSAGITYVNRKGLRRAAFRSGELSSMSTDNTVQSWAPFEKVED